MTMTDALLVLTYLALIAALWAVAMYLIRK
jgi:hypothetical protein